MKGQSSYSARPNVMVIGPSTPDFDSGYNKSIARAFGEAGFNAHLFEFAVTTPPGIWNRFRIDLAKALGDMSGILAYRRHFNNEVLNAYRTIRPELVFVIRGSKLEATTLATMEAATKVLWCHDLVRRSDLSPAQLASYDRIYVFEAQDVAEVKDAYGLQCSFLPLAADPDVYSPQVSAKKTNKDIDVFFVGAHYPRRTAILERLSCDFARRTLRFYGRYLRYREPATYRRFAGYAVDGRSRVFRNRSLQPAEINAMYNRSAIAVNIHHEQSHAGCNARVFEIMSSGAFQLVDRLAYIEKEFGDQVATYASYEEVRDCIEQYLSTDESREEKAAQACAYVHSRHTWRHRIGQVLADCADELRV